MEGLKILIRNIAFILLLATFLELLLPNQQMKGFVRMVMGLFVIAAIITPLADFFKLDFTNQVPALATSSSTDLPVLADEESSKQIGKSAVRDQYQKILEDQIRNLVSTVEAVKDVRVVVVLDKDKGGFSDYPAILKVNIVYSEEKNQVQSLKPIIIGGDGDSAKSSEESGKALEIKKQVSSLMQIPLELITVREE